MSSVSDVNAVLRRGDSRGEHDEPQQTPVRLSGTKTNTESRYEKNPNDGELGPAIGRQGNDWSAPYADSFLIGDVNGDRLQNLANTHLSEGEAPGRIPRAFHSKIWAILGQDITGERSGVPNTGLVKANQLGGARDQSYIQHIGIPRGSVVARAYLRSVDDSAPIPAVYVSNPTRR